MTGPRLEAIKMHGAAPALVPCTLERAWMDNTTNHHAYKCLPLTIANTHGWQLLCPGAFEVTWSGGPLIEDLSVRALTPFPEGMPFEHFAMSNFARGVVTFHTGYLFRTPPGWSLLTSGPFNDPHAGIAPLTGIIETDWLPYPFTMNWQMLHPGTVRFEKGDVFCTVMPIPKNYLDQWEVSVHSINDDPVLAAEQKEFQQGRTEFLRRMFARDPETLKQAWERHYFVGRHPDGTKGDDGHASKLRLASPVDRTGTRPMLAKETTASPAARTRLAAAVPRLWHPDSLLEAIDPRQTDANREGRLRLDNGVLRASPRTRTVVPWLERDKSFDFVCMPEFLTRAECALLAETAEALADKQHVADINDPFWKGRILFFRDVMNSRPGSAALMRDAQRRVTDRLRDFYKIQAPVFADTVQLVRWRAGMHMPCHADRANPDGSLHGMPFRDFGSVVYLNDDYAGGQLYFPRLDLVVQPAAGMLLAFTGGWHHEHGVLTVRYGERLTMPAFYTFDASQRDRGLYGSATL